MFLPLILSSFILSFVAIEAYVPTMSTRTTFGKTKVVATTNGDSFTSNRREALLSAAAFLAATAVTASPKPSVAGSLETNNPIPDNEFVPSQQARSDKLDINSAFVGDYMQFRGFFPHAAGIIASHGPYDKVSEIYDIEGVNSNDKKIFKKYEKELIVLPPSRRMLNERINAPVST